MIYFTSDTHFLHNSLTLAGNPNFSTKRPFKDVDDMNTTLIKNWNAKVKQNDEVYHLGDVCFGDQQKWEGILNRLMGRIYLIIGNHDQKLLKTNCINRFEWVKDYYELKTQNPLNNEKQFVVLSHYAHRVWNKSHKGAWMLYGHSHGSLKDDPNALSIDVGVDAGHNFYPLSLKEVAQIMSKKTWKPVDHHGTNTP